MSNALEDAFNFAASINKRQMQLTSIDGATDTIFATPANYFRNLEFAGGVVSEGHEFVVTKKELAKTTYTELKRGHRLVDSDFGMMSITEIRPVVVLGDIIGWRVRTD